MADQATPSDESLLVDAQLNLYHLHPSYNSSCVLVTQPLVGASNYSSWRKVGVKKPEPNRFNSGWFGFHFNPDRTEPNR